LNFHNFRFIRIFYYFI